MLITESVVNFAISEKSVVVDRRIAGKFHSKVSGGWVVASEWIKSST